MRNNAKPGAIVLAYEAGGDRSATMRAFRVLLPELKGLAHAGSAAGVTLRDTHLAIAEGVTYALKASGGAGWEQQPLKS